MKIACVTTLALIAWSPSALGNRHRPDAAPADAPSVSLNQAASVDPIPTADAGAPPAPPPVAARTPSGEPATIRPADAPTRTAFTRRNDRTATLAAGRRVPWYRSGLGALAVVLAVVAAAAWAFKRCVPSARNLSARNIRVIGRTHLAPKISVVLLSLGRRCVLVGIAGERATTLCEITDPDEIAEIMVAADTGRRNSDGFEDLLTREAVAHRHPLDTPEAEPRGIADERIAYRRPIGALLRRLKTLRTQ